MSAYAVRAGMKALVFVPAGKITAAKLAQALEFGATVIELDGNFDQAFAVFALVRARFESVSCEFAESVSSGGAKDDCL